METLVKLNIGGTVRELSRNILSKAPLFESLFDHIKDVNTLFFLDRDVVGFDDIVLYLGWNIVPIDLSSIYDKLKQHASISDDDLNIEGALFHNEKWHLFQRGNGAQSKNGIFIFNKEGNDIHFFPIPLPKIQNIEATFTDAILVENKIYFLAAVENTTSTYDDGEVLGSFIGALTIDNFQTEFTQEISQTHKFEGLTLYNNSKEKIEFLLCEDKDTEALETGIYKLTLYKNFKN